MPRDHALLLVAHGSERYPDAARIVRAHATALRDEHAFAQVAVGLLAGVPRAADALAALSAPVVHVVPFFMESGWFTRTAVPRSLGLTGSVTARGGQRLHYADPVGTHPDLAELIGARVHRLAGDVPAVVAIGHGSARAPGRVTALHGHVKRLAASDGFRTVEAAFLEEAPFAADAMARRRDSALAVVGFFAGEGGHVRDDLPALMAVERATRDLPLVDCGTVAEEPGLRRIILDLAAAIP